MKKIHVVMAVLVLCFMSSTVFAYTDKQASAGKQFYAKQCAQCHGQNGEGGTVPDRHGEYARMKVPAVVGKDALPNMKTAANAYAFIRNHMPLQNPGNLSRENALNLVAFALMANGIKADGQTLTVEKAKNIALH
jgi:cytochrome c